MTTPTIDEVYEAAVKICKKAKSVQKFAAKASILEVQLIDCYFNREERGDEALQEMFRKIIELGENAEPYLAD
jgi:hypothetical protein